MSADHSTHELGTYIPENNPESVAHRKLIWRTFWILLGLTLFEFVIAFTMHHSLLRVSIFIGMTIVKAFYIISEFMHLRYEVKSLIWAILIPLLFVVWLLIALIVEGGSILLAR